MITEKRNRSRRKFTYYMRVFDNSNSELIGYITDISPRGFKIDSTKPHAVNKEYTLRLDLTSDVSDRSFIIFVARLRWSQPDPTDPTSFMEGFQVMNISPHDEEIFYRMFDKYSTAS